MNLAGNQHVVLTTGSNQWKRGLDVVVEGVAARVTDDTRLRVLADLWRSKYQGDWDFAVKDGMFHHEDGARARVAAIGGRLRWFSARPVPAPGSGVPCLCRPERSSNAAQAIGAT